MSEKISGGGEIVRIRMWDFKSLRVAVMICATLVDRQIQSHTYRHTDRQTAFDRLY